jgi:hypothetical protein
MSPQEKRHGVMAQIQTSVLTIERPTLYHLSYPAIGYWSETIEIRTPLRQATDVPISEVSSF